MIVSDSLTLSAKKIKQQKLSDGFKVYDAGLGESPFPIDNNIINLLKKNISDNKYTSIVQTDQLKGLVWGDKILTGNGLKELIYCVQLGFSVTYDNYKIVYITPVWVSYLEQAKILRLNYTTLEVEQDTLKVNLDKLEKILSCDEKCLLIFNNPCNPTGLVYTNEEVKRLGEIIKKTDSLVLCDDIYQDIILKEDFGDLKKEIPEYCVSGSSLSKGLGCGGWRYGWLGFPKNLDVLYDNTRKVSVSMYSCPSAFFHSFTKEYLTLVKQNNITYEDKINTIKKCSKEIVERLKSTNINIKETEGAWYTVLDFTNYKKQLEKKGINNSVDLTDSLASSINLITVPLKGFGSDILGVRYSLIDINFNNQEPDFTNMLEGIDKLKEYLKKL